MMIEEHTKHATTRTHIYWLTSDENPFDGALEWPSQQTKFVLLLCVGVGPSSTLHHHYATQFGISLGSPFKVRTHTSEPYTEQQSFIIGPHIPHQVETTGMSSFVFWSESRKLAHLAHRLSSTSTSTLPTLPESLLNTLLPTLLAFEKATPDEKAGQALLSHILTVLIDSIGNEDTDDPRVITAQSLITPQFLLEQPQPFTRLASLVHLSPSRFRHLFRNETGMSIQSYLRWRRLLTAVCIRAHGASLTEAAHAAGFADSAHLTRVFHTTFGMPPSRFSKNSHDIQVIHTPPHYNMKRQT